MTSENENVVVHTWEDVKEIVGNYLIIFFLR